MRRLGREPARLAGKWLCLAAALALCSGIGAPTTPAVAGAKVSDPVQVGTGFARGGTGTARNSANTTEYIHCRSTATADPSGAGAPGFNIICEALQAPTAGKPNGVFGTCTVVDPTEAANALGGLPFMAPGAYLEFAWDSSGRCTYIVVRVASSNEPKEP